MTQRATQLLKFAGKLAVTIALLVWVFSRIDFAQLGVVIKTARWSFLWGVWILAIAVYWLYAVKMRLAMEKLDCSTDTHTIFAISMITSLYGMVLPGMVDTSVKWYMLKHRTGKGSLVFTSMVYNQFTTMVVVIATGLVALAAINADRNWKVSVVCFIVLVALVAICLMLLHEAAASKVAGVFRFLLKPFPRAVRNVALKIIKELSVFRTAPRSFHFIQLTLVLVSSTVLGSIIYLFAAKAARIDVPVGLLVCQCALVSILGRLPISVADLGVREATIVGSLSLYSVDASSALFMSLVIFSYRILLAFIGAIYLFYYTFRKIPRSQLPA
jgi:glycosyltransferase 2 family protein